MAVTGRDRVDRDLQALGHDLVVHADSNFFFGGLHAVLFDRAAGVLAAGRIRGETAGRQHQLLYMRTLLSPYGMRLPWMVYPPPTM